MLFCGILSLFALTYFVFRSLFCATMWSFSLGVYLKYKSSGVWFLLFVTWNIDTFVCLFFPHFCFLIIFVLLIIVLFVFLQVAIINLSLFFFIYSTSRLIDVSTISSLLVSPLTPFFFFLDIISLSTSFLWCKGLCIVMCFVLFCLVSLNGPKYCTRRRSLDVYLFNEISASLFSFELFPRSPDILFVNFFSFISISFIMSASSIPKYLQVSFSPSVLIFFLIWLIC